MVVLFRLSVNAHADTRRWSPLGRSGDVDGCPGASRTRRILGTIAKWRRIPGSCALGSSASLRATPRRAGEGPNGPDAWVPAEAAAHDGTTSDFLVQDALAGGDVSVPTSGFCALPGSVVYGSGGGQVVVPGGDPATDFSWLTLPDGFCVHLFANVPHVRQIRFAPGGELFAASPSMTTQGGGLDGKGAVLVLADDDANGVADAPYPVFLNNLPVTQGLLFTSGSFYYQDGVTIRRLDYHPASVKGRDLARKSSATPLTTTGFTGRSRSTSRTMARST